MMAVLYRTAILKPRVLVLVEKIKQHLDFPTLSITHCVQLDACQTLGGHAVGAYPGGAFQEQKKHLTRK